MNKKNNNKKIIIKGHDECGPFIKKINHKDLHPYFKVKKTRKRKIWASLKIVK